MAFNGRDQRYEIPRTRSSDYALAWLPHRFAKRYGNPKCIIATLNDAAFPQQRCEQE